MTFIDKLSRKLLAPPKQANAALFYAVVLVAVPTAHSRCSRRFPIDGLPFITYFPFVLLAAIWLSWRFAAAVALVSAIIADWLFVGPPQQLFEGPADVFGVIIFLATSVMMIALVEAVRSIVENSLRPARPDGVLNPGRLQPRRRAGMGQLVWIPLLGAAWPGRRGRRNDGGFPRPAGTRQAPDKAGPVGSWQLPRYLSLC